MRIRMIAPHSTTIPVPITMGSASKQRRITMTTMAHPPEPLHRTTTVTTILHTLPIITLPRARDVPSVGQSLIPDQTRQAHCGPLHPLGRTVHRQMDRDPKAHPTANHLPICAALMVLPCTRRTTAAFAAPTTRDLQRPGRPTGRRWEPMDLLAATTKCDRPMVTQCLGANSCLQQASISPSQNWTRLAIQWAKASPTSLPAPVGWRLLNRHLLSHSTHSGIITTKGKARCRHRRRCPIRDRSQDFLRLIHLILHLPTPVVSLARGWEHRLCLKAVRNTFRPP
jgi:hypothetical protein